MNPFKRKLDEYSTHELEAEVRRRRKEENVVMQALRIIQDPENDVRVPGYSCNADGGYEFTFEVNGGVE